MNTPKPEIHDLAALTGTSPARAAATAVWPPRGYPRQIARLQKGRNAQQVFQEMEWE